MLCLVALEEGVRALWMEATQQDGKGERGRAGGNNRGRAYGWEYESQGSATDEESVCLLRFHVADGQCSASKWTQNP